MIIKIHPQNPQEKEIKRVVDILENGGLLSTLPTHYMPLDVVF